MYVSKWINKTKNIESKMNREMSVPQVHSFYGFLPRNPGALLDSACLWAWSGQERTHREAIFSGNAALYYRARFLAAHETYISLQLIEAFLRRDWQQTGSTVNTLILTNLLQSVLLWQSRTGHIRIDLLMYLLTNQPTNWLTNELTN